MKSCMLPNVWELDELPFLKCERFALKADDGEAAIEEMRSVSHTHSDLMAKCFRLERKTKKPSKGSNTQHYKQLVVIREKQIHELREFYQTMNELMTQSEFSSYVQKIESFQRQVKKYFGEVFLSKELLFKKKEPLTFGIYLTKCSAESLGKENLIDQFEQIAPQVPSQKQYNSQNFFSIKCSLSSYDLQPSNSISSCQIQVSEPRPFVVEHPALIRKLKERYASLQSFQLKSDPKLQEHYVSQFDKIQRHLDEQHLKKQVYQNYPLLRVKYFVPLKFEDPLTNQRLDGLIFSNADPDCMFKHFTGYDTNTIKELEGNYCQECCLRFDQVQQNELLMNLRDHVFNPTKADILYCPQWNRFKVIKQLSEKNLAKKANFQQQKEKQSSPKKQNELLMVQQLSIESHSSDQNVQSDLKQGQYQEPILRKEIGYSSYLHLRSNAKKMYTKKRDDYSRVNSQNEIFDLTFKLWGRKLLIADPVRGKNCSHYSFCDLRLYYLNKKPQTNTYKCPIQNCGEQVSDNDLLYLREAEVILKYLKHKTKDEPRYYESSKCEISHFHQSVHIKYRYPIDAKNQEDLDFISKTSKRSTKAQNSALQTVTQQIPNLYRTLIDPYVGFSEYSLQIPSKYEEKIKKRYLFGPMNSEDQDENAEQNSYFEGQLSQFDQKRVEERIEQEEQ